VSCQITTLFRHKPPFDHSTSRVETIPVGSAGQDPDRDVYCSFCGAFFPRDDFDLVDSKAILLPVLA
jgi:hypothetical protein